MQTPDDTEVNRRIAEAETLAEALWAIGDKYDVPLTVNYPRWVAGSEEVYLRSVGDFFDEIITAAKRFKHEIN